MAREGSICTALGTIIASWPAQNATEKNNWVLTDGSRLNVSTKNTCAPTGRLVSIKIFASNEFTNNQANSAQLGLLACTTVGVCSDSLNGTFEPIESILTPVNNAILFSFHTSNPLPYVDVEKAATNGNPAPTSIELANSNNATPVYNVDPAALERFLTPIANTIAPGSAPSTPGTVGAQSTELGMPYIDGNGKITGAQIFNSTFLASIANILTLEKQPAFPQEPILSQLLSKNTLSQQWDTGIIQYEQGNYRGAVQTLSSIQNAPPTFQAPAAFKSKAQAKIPTSQGTQGTSPTATNGQGNQSILPLVIGLIAGILALVLLFLIVSNFFKRLRLKRKRELNMFEADVNRARQSVDRKEIPQPQQYSPSPPFYLGAVNYPVAAPPAPAMPELRCPNCGAPVDEHAAFCPNCRYPIKPADAESRHYPSPPGILAPITADPRPTIQPQQPAQTPKMQDDPAIQATLQRLWDKAGR